MSPALTAALSHRRAAVQVVPDATRGHGLIELLTTTLLTGLIHGSVGAWCVAVSVA